MSLPFILCIDDDLVILKMLESQLKKYFAQKFQLRFVPSGNEAVLLCESCKQNQEEIAVVICDQNMPGMSGVETLTKIAGLFPSAKSIMLTGIRDPNVISSAVNQAQLFYFLQKPWKGNELIEIVEKSLIVWKQAMNANQKSLLYVKQILKDVANIQLVGQKTQKLQQAQTAILHLEMTNLNQSFMLYNSQDIIKILFEIYGGIKSHLDANSGQIVSCDGHSLMALIENKDIAFFALQKLRTYEHYNAILGMHVGLHYGDVIWGNNMGMNQQLMCVGPTVDEVQQLTKWAIEDNCFALVSEKIVSLPQKQMSNRSILSTTSGQIKTYTWP